MTYPGLKLFMEKLKQMIYSNDDPLISNHPSVLSVRPQLQLVYEELGSMIQILFVKKRNYLHKLEEVKILKERFKDVIEEAHDMLDLFVLDTHIESESLFHRYVVDSFPRTNSMNEPFVCALTEDVMRSIKSIKEDYFTIHHNMKMEPSTRTNSLKTQSAADGVTSSSRNSLGSNILLDEIVVGLDYDVDLIRDKLAQDTRTLDIVSIVGMGGLGKTTLATKVFNDSFVRYHFKIRGWVTVSQTYEKADLLNRLLASIGVEIDPDKRHLYSHLREMLHKSLMRGRYLVVIDDIWNTEAWDVLKVVFPNYENGSRLLLTSRHKIVALHAKPHGFVHQLRCLTDEESWELLQKKVFRGHDFPDSLTGPGMKIASNCHGLPLAVVVIAGVLAKEPLIKDSWDRISQSSSSLIVMETLALSVNHLPPHLRNCFLYLGGFPEDYRFGVTRFIWLWIAEGFIQESENQSLEETAKDYLIELIDRNLVVVQDKKFDREIKTFSVHDVLRELSSEIAIKERFSIQVLGWENCIIAPYKTSHLIMSLYTKPLSHSPHSPLWPFGMYRHEYSYGDYITLKCSRSWRLLTVLDLKQWYVNYFPEKILLLVNLKYLAIRNYHKDFQSTICDLKSLQTLITEGISDDPLVLPDTISNMVNLRHLHCRRAIMFTPLQMPLMNLQTISNVVLGHEPTSWLNYFPVVKKLSCFIHENRRYDLKSLTYLEILKIRNYDLKSPTYLENLKIRNYDLKSLSMFDISGTKSKIIPRFSKKSMIRFPVSLKKLTLDGCHLPWSHMSYIQSLPNLEVLKLLTDAFVGPQWDASEEPFQQLKFLKLSCLDIEHWEASSINFPCLKKLVLYRCFFLERIPLDMTYIPTIEDIQIEGCSNSVIESAYEIQEEAQQADGNYDITIRVENNHLTTLIQSRRAVEISMKELNKVMNDTYGSKSIVRTGISINLLTPQELQALGLPINHPQAHHRIRKGRIWNGGRSKNRPSNGKF